jgi:hypothetical protein
LAKLVKVFDAGKLFSPCLIFIAKVGARLTFCCRHVLPNNIEIRAKKIYSIGLGTKLQKQKPLSPDK